MTVISICVFGSIARGNSDGLSDKDVLVVCDSRVDAQATIDKWSSVGWSVAFYTRNRLRKMSKSGSLFVQHLKQDGVVIFDKEDWLHNLLDAFRPKRSYAADLLRSECLARPADRVPSNLSQSFMLCDVLYTYSRNACILYLASRGRFVFDYSRLLTEMADVAGFNTSILCPLGKLRELKSQYRTRRFDNLEVDQILVDSKKAISSIFGVKFSDCHARSRVRLLSLPYATLRDAEACLLSSYPIGLLDLGEVEPEILSIWASILNPRRYCWEVKDFNISRLDNLNRMLSADRRGLRSATRSFGRSYTCSEDPADLNF